jgi:hypothetical protein
MSLLRAIRPDATPQRRRLYGRFAARHDNEVARNKDMPGSAMGQSPLPAKGV